MNRRDHLFADSSMTRLIDGQLIQAVGAGRILLLQLAHPQVARAVNEHGDFLTHPWRRLARTMKHAQSINRGSRNEALETIRKINKIHERVIGDNYSARDPKLLLWVLATMAQTSWACYEGFIGPLSIEDKNDYWQETKYLGELFGIPKGEFPDKALDFEEYFDFVVNNDLQVTLEGRMLASRVLRPPLSIPLPRFIYFPNVLTTTALLPVKIREGFELPWGSRERIAWHSLQKGLQWMARITKA